MAHTLLLADDSVTIQRVIELTFADEDIKVIAVGDGQQAIARIDAEPPDVVLADIGMPERDGYEVAAHVKNTPHLSHIPVLLLTGAFEPIDENRARAVGCDGVLVKPFEPQMVINRVRDLIAGRRPSSLWGGAPGTASDAPAADASPAGPRDGVPQERSGGAPAGAARSAESLNDYFDRLDAAFSGDVTPTPLPGGPPAGPSAPASRQPAPESGSEFGDWDIGLRDASRAGAAPQPDGRDADAQPAAPPEMPPLADAFAALLAAEQRLAAAPPGSALSDEAIDEIARRVIARMTDDVVRATVLDVAERLVREEIERIKNQR